MVYLLLILYFIVLVVFIIISGMGYYHLWRYGYRGDLTKIIMLGYLVIMGTIIIFSILIMATLNWSSFNFNFQGINLNLFGR